MCENYKYMLQIKPEFDEKFKKTGVHAQMFYLCEVRDVANGTFKLNYDSKRFNLLVKECGKCRQCRYKKASIKACQAQSEYKTTGKGSFITLTFGDKQIQETLKTDKRYKNMSDYMKQKYRSYLQWTLEKREFQLFMKRLRYEIFQQDLYTFSVQNNLINNLFTNTGRPRKKIIMSKEYDYSDFKPRKIRFMHCGEYGSEHFTSRPHHHAIIFGLDFGFDSNKVRYSIRKQRNVVIHFNNLLSKLWPFGDATTDRVNYQACNYVARYITKKVVNMDKKTDIAGSIYKGRCPEYMTQSNRRGLGYQYYMDNMKKINSDLKLYFKNNKGELKECPLPRYFKELMKKHDKISYLRMQKDSVDKQLQFSNTLPELLCSLESSYKRKAQKQYNDFKGNLEELPISTEQSNYLNYELKKQVFPEYKNNYKRMYSLSYKDSEFVDTDEELWRVQKYKEFEKWRKLLIKNAKFNYVKNKMNYMNGNFDDRLPQNEHKVLSLYQSIKNIKEMENHYKLSYLNS